MMKEDRLPEGAQANPHTPRADACAACGLCVVACPEKAIALLGPEER